MTSAIALFGAFENHDVRWNGDLDKPEWIAQDVATVLGIRNYRQVISRYPDTYQGVTISDGLDGKQRDMLTLTEPGLYRMIFASRKSEAEKFRAWVFHEVLPSIRKYGCYPPPADEEQEWTWEIAIFAFLLRLGMEFGEAFELNDCRVVAALGFGLLRQEDISNAAIAASLGLDEMEVFRRVDRLREWGVVDDQRLLLLPQDLLPHTPSPQIPNGSTTATF